MPFNSTLNKELVTVHEWGSFCKVSYIVFAGAMLQFRGDTSTRGSSHELQERSIMHNDRDRVDVMRNGPRILDSALSEISAGFQAASSGAAWSKYTASGVRRSRAL